MRFNDLINPDQLAAAMSDGLVRVRESGDGQQIYNYTDAALWTPGAWDNPAVRQCRGLIVEQGRVIARPWAKFFNHGQAEAGQLDLDAPVEVTDKIDGSLGILHYDPTGRARVATRGSFQSEQAHHATDLLTVRFSSYRWPVDFTPLVEIVYPGNRIVCNYGPMDSLILLGAVHIQTGRYIGPNEASITLSWPGAVTETFPYQTLRDALAAPPRSGAEGMCVRYEGQDRIVKIKQDDYIALHRIVTGLSERTVWQAMVDGQEVTDLLAGIPDELHGWITDVWSRLRGDTERILLRAEGAAGTIRSKLPDGWTRRDYAEQALRHPDLTPYLFQILDDRDPTPAILKKLRPAGDTHAIYRSEDVA